MLLLFHNFTEETEAFDDDLEDSDYQLKEVPTETGRQEAVGNIFRIYKSQITPMKIPHLVLLHVYDNKTTSLNPSP